MIHDLIGIKESDFDSLLNNINTATITNGAHWMHDNRSSHSSASVKLDKYIFEELKKYIHSKRPRQGAFSKQTIKMLLEKHADKKYVFITDIRHYFESIRFDIVVDDIQSSLQPTAFTDIIKELYFTPNNELKRGLKGSATISEFVGMKIDGIINPIVHKGNSKKQEYSRYYDDIIISSNSIKELELIKVEIKDLLYKQLGLDLNDKKTRIRNLQGARVLGMRFHNNEIIVPQSFKKKVRAVIHSYERSSYDEAELEGVHSAKSHVGTVIGSIRYLLDSSDSKNVSHEALLAEYYDELERLEAIRKELLEEGAEYQEA